MKRIYLLSLWLLACLVLPLQGQAVSQAELLNSEQYQHVDSNVDSGRAKQANSGITGEITSSIAFNNDGGTRRQRIHIDNLKAIILPAEFGDEKYKLPNLVYQKVYGIAYDDEP